MGWLKDKRTNALSELEREKATLEQTIEDLEDPANPAPREARMPMIRRAVERLHEVNNEIGTLRRKLA